MKDAAPCTFALAGALVLSAIGAVQSNETIPDLKDPNVISVGRELYLEKHCSHCHGANGDGGVNLMRSKEKKNVMTWLLEQRVRIAPGLFINRSTQRIHQAANAITLKDYSA